MSFRTNDEMMKILTSLCLSKQIGQSKPGDTTGGGGGILFKGVDDDTA